MSANEEVPMIQDILNKLNFLPALGLSSTQLLPEEEKWMLELATEVRKTYDGAVERLAVLMRRARFIVQT